MRRYWQGIDCVQSVIPVTALCRTVLIGRSTVSSCQQGDTSVSEGCEFYVTSVMEPIEEQKKYDWLRKQEKWQWQWKWCRWGCNIGGGRCGRLLVPHACQWYQQTWSFVLNRCCIYQHVLREVILWPLYFMEGNDVTPHYRSRRNSVLFST